MRACGWAGGRVFFSWLYARHSSKMCSTVSGGPDLPLVTVYGLTEVMFVEIFEHYIKVQPMVKSV